MPPGPVTVVASTVPLASLSSSIVQPASPGRCRSTMPSPSMSLNFLPLMLPSWKLAKSKPVVMLSLSSQRHGEIVGVWAT